MQSVPTSFARNLPTTTRMETLRYGSDPSAPPVISIIVPTLDRARGGILDELLDDLHDQVMTSFEVILVIGDRRQGRAINRGVDAAQSDLIATMDDDTKIGTPHLLQNLVDVLRAHDDVGIVGASTVVPPECSWFQRTASEQIPRRLFPVVQEITDSDMVQHPCLAMRRDVFLEIGGEDEELIRGLDPSLRHRAKAAGYRVVIAPHTYICHMLPEGFRDVIRMYYRNGRGSAFAQRHYPERIYNLSDGFQNNQFPEKVAFPVRVASYPRRMLGSLLRLRWIKFAVEVAYTVGFMREYVRPTPARG